MWKTRPWNGFGPMEDCTPVKSVLKWLLLIPLLRKRYYTLGHGQIQYGPILTWRYREPLDLHSYNRIRGTAMLCARYTEKCYAADVRKTDNAMQTYLASLYQCLDRTVLWWVMRRWQQNSQDHHANSIDWPGLRRYMETASISGAQSSHRGFLGSSLQQGLIISSSRDLHQRRPEILGE